MNTCETCQAQLLNLLYGVLSEEEQKACLDHLSSCPSCIEALAKARQQQALIGLAAKTEFPEVRFTAETPSASEPTRILPRPRKPAPWGRWAVAASLLLVFAAGSLFAYLGWQDRRHQLALAQDKLAQAQGALNQFQSQNQSDQQRINQEIRAIQDQIQRLTADWDKEVNQVERSIQTKKVQFKITGPRNLQPGAPNAYQIEMQSQDAKALPKGDLSVRVINPQDKKVLFEKKIANRGKVDVALPANLPVKPGVNLAMEVEGELDGVPMLVSEPVPLIASLYMTHVATDRPMYRPGEVVHFRSLTLERHSLKPAQEDVTIAFRITAPNGSEIYKAEGPARVVAGPGQDPIKGPDGQPVRGLAAGEFQLPADLSGGEYTLHVSDQANRFQPEKRKFLVNRYQAPRLNKELTFTRKSYGPGEEVEVQGTASRVEGGQAGPMKVVVSAQVDGKNIDVAAANLTTDAEGKVKTRFTLPKVIERGEGSLSLQFQDGGNTETIVRPIPIVLKKLLVDFYPEGGDLVAGLANRVYFQVQTTLNKPAELRGRIIDKDGKTVAQAATLNDDDEAGVNQGMGMFEFTPQAGQKYELKIESPIGMESRHVLPEAKADGVVLAISKGVVEDHIDVTLSSAARDRKLMVGAYCRGRLIDNSTILEVAKGETAKVKLRTAPGASGVYRVTVFERNPVANAPGVDSPVANAPGSEGAEKDQLVPVAERLIYRRPVEKLDIHLTADKKVYAPGEPVKLSLRSNREDKALMPSILMLSVVDLSVLKLADEKTARSMPAHFYLTTEVKNPDELEYADFLVSDHPKATIALDLLLGTQGWRRFAEQNPAEFLKKHHNAQRYLAYVGAAGVQTRDVNRLVLDKVDSKFAPKCALAELSRIRKEKEQQGVIELAQKEGPSHQVRVQAAQAGINQSSSQLDEYQGMLARVAVGVLIALVLVAGFVCVLIGLMRIGQEGPGGAGFLATGICLILFLLVGGMVAAVSMVTVQRVREAGARRAEKDMAAMAPGEAGMDMPENAIAKGAQEMPDVFMMKMKKKGGAAFPIPAPMPLPRENLAEPMMPKAKAAKVFAGEAKIGAAGDDIMDKMAGPMRGRPRPGREPFAEGAAVAPVLADQIMPPGKGRPGGGGFLAALRRGDMDRQARRALLAQALAEPFVVREYAHRHQTSPDQVRRDFTETLFWHPVVVLADGSGEVRFDLSDATTRFQVLAMGHTLDGRLGTSTLEVASRLPFSVEPKVPIEVSSTDKIIIPVTIDNASEQKRTALIEASAQGLEITGKKSDSLDLDAHQRKPYLFHVRPNILEGQAVLSFTGKFLPIGVDSVERSFPVVPDGFPIMNSKSDMLEGVARQEITLPETWTKGTLKVQVQAFPSTLADLQKGLEAMLQEPGGCFEQSSSSNYPNVLILNYLKESEQNLPEVEKRARQLLTNGYQRLTSFECIPPEAANKKRGYEWFGQTAPPHEALTAYGLLQFRDMAKVHPVEQEMVERTRKYLLEQRDGKSGFKRNDRALDTFGRAPADITNAYIVWAITESGGDEDIDKELKSLTALAKDSKDASKDAYFLALVGNALINRNQTKEGLDVLNKLVGQQKDDGHLEGTRTSITGSQGRDLQVETTALTILALLKANRPDFNNAVQKATKWLGQQRGGHGGFGATQSTILALKALISHARTSRSPAEDGELKLYLNDGKEPVAVKAFIAKSLEPLIVSVPREDLLKAGKNNVRVEISGKNAFPYTLSWSYRTVKPANPENCPVHVTTKLARAKVKEGETVQLKAVIENKSGKGQGMAVAILGIPAGLQLPENFAQLKEMARLRDNGTKPGKISFFEVRGRELVLYWRDLAPEQKIEVDIDLICRLPGEYRGPASRAYLYYNSDLKFWTDPLSVAVLPAE